MTDKEEYWRSFNSDGNIWKQAGIIKELTEICSWYEWSGFYIGAYVSSYKHSHDILKYKVFILGDMTDVDSKFNNTGDCHLHDMSQ